MAQPVETQTEGRSLTGQLIDGEQEEFSLAGHGKDEEHTVLLLELLSGAQGDAHQLG
jgi:hypothetical protein